MKPASSITPDPSSIPTTQQGLDTWVVAVPAGLNALGILENNNSSGFASAGGDSVSVAMQTSSSLIPEPATLSLLSFGAASLVAVRRRRRTA
jgi:hypothetical protein